MSKRAEIAKLKRKAMEAAMFSDVAAISALIDELSAAAAGGPNEQDQTLAQLFEDAHAQDPAR